MTCLRALTDCTGLSPKRNMASLLAVPVLLRMDGEDASADGDDDDDEEEVGCTSPEQKK